MGPTRIARGAALLLISPALGLAQTGDPPAGSTARFPPPDEPSAADGPAVGPGAASAAPATPSAPTSAPALPPQPAPPPGYGYPPPAHGYPPPPGYYYPPPGYYYPPPGYAWAPPASPKPRYPEDAAGQTSPYIDLLTAGLALDKRFDHFLAIGAQGGVYVASRFRFTARALMFTSGPDDALAKDHPYYDADLFPTGHEPIASDTPVLVYGASAGIGAVVGTNFVFAPGVAFLRSDVEDYGTFVALSMPFEWVTDEGARFGFEVDIGRAFAGRIASRCEPPLSGSCAEAEARVDRPAGPGFYAAFQGGWGFNRPRPKPSN